jgi:hypothetical protein
VTVAIRAGAVLALVISVADVRAADPLKEIAALFPAETLAYAELCNTAELAPQLAAMFRGSVLEDSIPFIHNRKDAAKSMAELGNKRSVALLGLLASPEMLAEFKRLRIAAGVMGFAESGDPEAAIVILTHDSPAAGLAARAYLTMSTQLRRVGEVAKVPVFQSRTPNISYDPNGNPLIQNDKPFTDGPHELTFAYTPGLFAIGTSKAAVGRIIKRYLGVEGEKSAGLDRAAAFRDAVAAHRQTGLFFYVDYPELSSRFGKAAQAGERHRQIDTALRSLWSGGEWDALEWFNLTANPRAVKGISGCIRFRDGGLQATVAVTLDPAQKSPLFDFLSGPPVPFESLHHAHCPASLAVSVTLPEKNRAEAVIGLLDAIAKADGVLGKLPRDIVKELTEKHKIAVAEGLIGKVRVATIVVPSKQELPKGGKPGPMLVLHAMDAGAAGAWDEFLPKLVGELAGAAAPPQPSVETIKGVKVFTVAGAGLRWNAPIHFARSGSVVAVGLDRKLVAAAVGVDAPGSVVGGDKAISPPGGDPPALFGVVSLGEVLPVFFEKPRGSGPVVPVEEPAVLPNGQPIPESMIQELKKARKGLAAALTALSPATVTARRKGNELRFEVFQPRVLQSDLKAVIDATANWLDRSGGLSGQTQGLPVLDRFRER